MSASIGDAVDPAVANLAPILDTQAVPLGPTLNTVDVPDLPLELQPAPGDVLLASPVWPWEDLGAKGIPEHWLYMSRHVQGTVALLAVQTANGPKLVNANPDGTIFSAPPNVLQVIPTYSQDRNGNTLLPQRAFQRLNSMDAVTVLANSTTLLLPGVINTTIKLKKICISDAIAATHKFTVQSGAQSVMSIVLPPNPMPFIYEWEDDGYQAVLGGADLNLISDHAGVVSCTIEYNQD